MDGSITDSQLPRSNKLVLIFSPFLSSGIKLKSLVLVVHHTNSSYDYVLTFSFCFFNKILSSGLPS
jgi:hypothetical protein